MTAARPYAIAAALCIAIALIALHPAGEPGVDLRDFEAYYSAGATWLAHGDPYGLEIVRAQSMIPGVRTDTGEALPFVGLPATLPLWALFALLPYGLATHAWSVILVASLAVLVAVTRALLQLNAPQTLLAALLSLAFVPITSDFGLGQAALPAFAATAAAVALLAHPIRASVALVLAALQPNVALAFAAMLRRRAGWIVGAGAAFIVYAIGAVAAGGAWPLTYARTLAQHAAAERLAAIQYTPAAVLFGYGVDERVALAMGWSVGLVVLAVALRAFFRAGTTVERFAIACAALPLCSGFFHEHDYVVLFVPAIYALTKGRGRASDLAIVATALVAVNWLDFAQQPAGVAQDATLALAALFAAVGLTGTTTRVYALPILGVAALVALGVAVGRSHPVPIWPNDMQPLHDAATTIAARWKEEQLQTGLLSPAPAAAFLRTIALLGNALLFYVTLDIDVHHVIERRDVVGVEVL